MSLEMDGGQGNKEVMGRGEPIGNVGLRTEEMNIKD